jgi:hypothetical protein
MAPAQTYVAPKTAEAEEITDMKGDDTEVCFGTPPLRC